MASIINVDKVRATGSTTDGLVINSSGQVTMPQAIAFQAQKNDITANGGAYSTTGNITFNDTTVTHSAWDGTTFTAPVAGTYSFSFSCHRQSTDNEPTTIRFRKNSTDLVEFYGLNASTARLRMSGTYLISLAANDTVTCRLNGGDFFAGTPSGVSSGIVFCGHLVG